MPAPPIPTKCRRRPAQGALAPAAHRGPAPACTSSPAISRAASRARPGRARPRPSPPAGAGPRAAPPTSRAQALGGQLGVRRRRRPRRRAPSSARWRPGGRPPRTGRGSRIAGRPAAAISKIEPPARATTRSPASSASPNAVEEAAQVVVPGRGRQALRRAGRSRSPATCRTRNGAASPNASTAASLIERAPSEPAEDAARRLVRRRARSARAPRRGRSAGAGTGRPVTR